MISKIKYIYSDLKKIWPYLLFLFCTFRLSAQEKPIRGVVFDRDSKIRLARVYITNTRTQIGFYNNTKGEFSTRVQKGDLLIARLEGYRTDTIRIDAQSDVVFFLKRNSIRLKEVVIRDTLSAPEKKLQEIKEEYKDIYRKGNSSDILTIGGPNGLGGAGLSIDALYSLFSREGKNARKLQKMIDRDYMEVVIDYRYTPLLVQRATGLSGLKLKDFMQQYRPSYSFVTEATDYQLLLFIQSSYQKYLKNPATYRLPTLK